MLRILANFVFAFLFLCCSRSPRLNIYYGSHFSKDALSKYDFVIVEPDNVNPQDYKDVPTKFIAYLSVGEINTTRPYWPLFALSPFVLEKNPLWPESHFVDFRSPEWRAFLKNTLIPNLITRGFQGLFLDTIDTTTYLEDTQPKDFKGQRESLVAFVKDLRKSFPKVLILPNNGLEFLSQYGEDIDGVVVEDLYTHYDFENKTFQPPPAKETSEKENLLVSFYQATHKPVYVIGYCQEAHDSLCQAGYTRAKHHGFGWMAKDLELVQW